MSGFMSLLTGGRRAAWRSEFLSIGSEKSVLEVLHFWLCCCTFVTVMRVRKNILPPTILSRPYSLSGRTVVKVGVGRNCRRQRDATARCRESIADFRQALNAHEFCLMPKRHVRNWRRIQRNPAGISSGTDRLRMWVLGPGCRKRE